MIHVHMFMYQLYDLQLVLLLVYSYTRNTCTQVWSTDCYAWQEVQTVRD